MPVSHTDVVERIARAGGTPLVVAENNRTLGVIYLKDIVKGGMRQRFDHPPGRGLRQAILDFPFCLPEIAVGVPRIIHLSIADS